MTETTLIVSGGSTSATDLWQVLSDDGITAAVRTPQSALTEWWAPDRTPDLLLVDASADAPVDVATIRSLVDRIVAAAGHPPAVVSFADADNEQLELHVRDGGEFLLAPFAPHLVRQRLAVTRHARELGVAMSGLQHRDMERDLRIGREIQLGFLPQTLPVIAGWDIAAWFQPAREVSGDFYDAYDVINGSCLAFAIADVCDKGIGAALFMALIRSLLRQAAAAAQPSDEPSAGLALHAVRTVNDYLTANHLHQAYFATLFFGVVDPRTGELVYINCGHNPPLIRRAGGTLQSLEPTGPAVGLIPDAGFDLGRTGLGPGDLLFLYTDGVPEAKSTRGDFFGDDRTRALLAAGGTADEIVQRFATGIRTHSGAASQHDDVTMLALRRRALEE
ncbi:PP2C family protein-serine/threonine phosphatase [Actinoplanes sp. RD1]|uniref:PP2C family protein-serine/threonine phosphatase n=1 Tax=Actinoplanes sp. RD1 TaxID=3064538 RepID=UPI002740D12A|nr:PP2C family protein-serine/threonine phosphatase [Actinoplanes sp. RD1]